MKPAHRIRDSLTNSLDLSSYISQLIKSPHDSDTSRPTKLHHDQDTGTKIIEYIKPEPDSLVSVVSDPKFKSLPVLQVLKLRDILRFKIQTCMLGAIKMVDFLRAEDVDSLPDRDETHVLAKILALNLKAENTGVTAYSILVDPHASTDDEESKKDGEDSILIADRDLLVDEDLFNYSFWTLYDESQNSEDATGDPMSRSAKFRKFMISVRTQLFRLVNIQLLNLVESYLFHDVKSYMSQLLFNLSWFVCGINNCSIFRDPNYYSNMVDRAHRCGRLMDDDPSRLMSVLANMGAVNNPSDQSVKDLLADSVLFIAGTILERYFTTNFTAKTPDLMYSALNEYDRAYVEHARQSMCGMSEVESGDVSCFMFIRHDRAGEFIPAWGNRYHRDKLKDAYAVSVMFSRRELAKLAKYIEMRLYSWIYFVGRAASILTKDVQFRMGDASKRIIKADNLQKSTDTQRLAEIFKYAALSTVCMDSAYGVQVLEMFPLVGVDFDDSPTERDQEQAYKIRDKAVHGTTEEAKKEAETKTEVKAEEVKTEEPEAKPMTQEELDELFGSAPEAGSKTKKREEAEEEEFQLQDLNPANLDELDELLNSPVKKRTEERPREERRRERSPSPEERPRSKLSPSSYDLFEQEQTNKDENETELEFMPVKKRTTFG